MPCLRRSLPELSRHRDSAVVYLGSKQVYLSHYGTKPAQAEYDRVVGDWVSTGRVIPPNEGVTVA